MLFSGVEDEDVDELPELDHYYRSKAGTPSPAIFLLHFFQAMIGSLKQHVSSHLLLSRVAAAVHQRSDCGVVWCACRARIDADTTHDPAVQRKVAHVEGVQEDVPLLCAHPHVVRAHLSSPARLGSPPNSMWTSLHHVGGLTTAQASEV
jgi:hypothetical protein